jgi:hypothetical protein
MPEAVFDLAPGLLDYYSSQADLMLGQFDNINRLLGPTTDWTHPGDFCEILLRDFLRRLVRRVPRECCGGPAGTASRNGACSPWQLLGPRPWWLPVGIPASLRANRPSDCFGFRLVLCSE